MHQSLTGLSVQNCSLIYMVLSGLRWPESSVLFDQTKELSFSVPWSLAYTFWQIPGKISYEHCFSSSGYSLLLFHIALTGEEHWATFVVAVSPIRASKALNSFKVAVGGFSKCHTSPIVLRDLTTLLKGFCLSWLTFQWPFLYEYE